MAGFFDLDKRNADRVCGILSSAEIAKLSVGARRVMELLSDGLWHEADEIRRVASVDSVQASEGLRRMRELTPRLKRHGIKVEKRPVGSSKRNWEYRIQEIGR